MDNGDLDFLIIVLGVTLAVYSVLVLFFFFLP